MADPTDPTGAQAPDGKPSQADPAASAAPTPEQVRAQVLAELQAELKSATGHDSIAALKAAQAKAEAERLAEQGRYKELAESAQSQLTATKALLDGERIGRAILSAAAESVDPETVDALLRHRAQVSETGAVTVDGKPVATAVAELLAAKPHLAKPAGGQGSGAGASGSAGARSLSRGAFEALSPEARMAHIRAGGLVTE